MANNPNIVIPPYLPDTILDDLGIGQCFTPASGGLVDLDTYLAGLDDDVFLIATNTNSYRAWTNYSANLWCFETPLTYEEVFDWYSSAFPNNLIPQASTWNGVTHNGLRMNDISWNYGQTADTPCGTFETPTFSVECNIDTNQWKSGAIFVTDYSIYRQIPGFTCPENTYYKNGECFPYPGYDEIGGKLPTGVPVPSTDIIVIVNDVDCSSEFTKYAEVDCSDIDFFWESYGHKTTLPKHML